MEGRNQEPTREELVADGLLRYERLVEHMQGQLPEGWGDEDDVNSSTVIERLSNGEGPFVIYKSIYGEL